jgi:hypothetical protein
MNSRPPLEIISLTGAGMSRSHNDDSHAVDGGADFAILADGTSGYIANLVSVPCHDGWLTVAHPGDSRLYRCRGDASTSSLSIIRCCRNRSIAASSAPRKRASRKTRTWSRAGRARWGRSIRAAMADWALEPRRSRPRSRIDAEVRRARHPKAAHGVD